MRPRFFERFSRLTNRDLLVDMHVHSTWTDGVDPVKALVGRARQLGLTRVAITDHCRRGSTYQKAYAREIGRTPDILHSNYADSGLVCTILSRELGIPQVHTGHSLGKPKMERLGVTEDKFAEIDSVYHFTERMNAEQETFEHASAIVVSTQQERVEQYGMYDIDVNDPKFMVCPPGIEIERFWPYWEYTEQDWQQVRRWVLTDLADLDEPEKPLVYSLGRLDMRKNLHGLVEAFGMDGELSSMANLYLSAGGLDDVSALTGEGEASYSLMQEFVEKYNLKGKVRLRGPLVWETEAPELYRYAARTGGVFVNSAFTEPFGLTIIEAMAAGLPVVATDDGGPKDIITPGENGSLVNVRDHAQMTGAIRQLLRERDLWEKFSRKGRERAEGEFTWSAMARKETELFKRLVGMSK